MNQERNLMAERRVTGEKENKIETIVTRDLAKFKTDKITLNLILNYVILYFNTILAIKIQLYWMLNGPHVGSISQSSYHHCAPLPWYDNIGSFCIRRLLRRSGQ